MRTTLSFIGIAQINKGDNWSIMNDKGEIVVKEELAYGSILIQVLQKN